LNSEKSPWYDVVLSYSQIDAVVLVLYSRELAMCRRWQMCVD